MFSIFCNYFFLAYTCIEKNAANESICKFMLKVFAEGDGIHEQST